jgi:hypothetical protein
MAREESLDFSTIFNYGVIVQTGRGTAVYVMWRSHSGRDANLQLNWDALESIARLSNSGGAEQTSQRGPF